jgi:uncharacterized RDD family membrane protein YckC
VRIDRPVSGLARRSRTLLAGEVERTIDAVLAGPLPERVARSVVEHRVLERMVAELGAAYAERGYEDAGGVADELLRSEEMSALLAALVERVLEDPATRRGIAGLLETPELRAAVAATGGGFASDVADALRARLGRWDDGLQTAVRRLLRRHPARVRGSDYGGGLARALALVLDAALVQAAFLVGAGSLGLVLALAGVDATHPAVAAVAALGWAAVGVGYFVGFWSTTGQTPGMRLVGVAVATHAGWGVPPGRAVLRLAGLVASILLLFAGFVPAFVELRRRALPDLLAGTVVLRRSRAPASTGWGDVAGAGEGDPLPRPTAGR